MTKKITAWLLAAAFLCPFSAVSSEGADAGESIPDGSYRVAVSNDMPMGKDNISDSALLEKQGGLCYLSLTFRTVKLADIRLEIDGKTVGVQLTEQSDGSATYCYTLSEETIAVPLPFTADVVPMGKDGLNRQIKVSVDLSSAERTGEPVEDRGERPAEFVPVLVTNAGGEYLLERGSAFAIPPASASLGQDACSVSVSAFYLDGGELQEVPIEGNQIRLEHSGEYRVVYRASSPDYQTSSGADTYAEYTVRIFSEVGASPLASFEDVNDILPDNVALQASRIREGARYREAARKMKTISDRYEVFDVNLYDAEGGAAELTAEILIGILKNTEYAGNEIAVYYLDESGRLGKLACEEDGGYVRFLTDRLGTFILCVPGVAFVMPMWGYAAILAACILAAAAVLAVVVRKRKKRRKETESGEK